MLRLTAVCLAVFVIATLMAMTGRGGGNFYVLALVAATALMGFIGHSVGGDFNASWALPTAAVAVLGGLLEGTFSLKTKPEKLKKLFAYTTLIGALFMAAHAALSPSH